MFHTLKRMVSRSETVCFSVWNESFHPLKLLVSSAWNKKFQQAGNWLERGFTNYTHPCNCQRPVLRWYLSGEKVGGYSFDLRGLGSVLRDKSDSKAFFRNVRSVVAWYLFRPYKVRCPAGGWYPTSKTQKRYMWLIPHATCIFSAFWKWGQSMPVAGIHIGFTMLM